MIDLTIPFDDEFVNINLRVATEYDIVSVLNNYGEQMKIKYVLLDGVAYGELSRYAATLPRERQEKIERLRFEKDKLLSLVAGLLIRHEIGDVPMVVNEHGKPYVDGAEKFFSLSHSGTCVMIAVDDREIGADVEKLPEKDFLKIAERFYHPNEREYVKRAADPARAFTHIWTRKEAYLKQLGIGIATDLTAFDTTSGELSERLRTFDIEGYAISVCTEYPLNDETYISKLELKCLLKQD